MGKEKKTERNENDLVHTNNQIKATDGYFSEQLYKQDCLNRNRFCAWFVLNDRVWIALYT